LIKAADSEAEADVSPRGLSVGHNTRHVGRALRGEPDLAAQRLQEISQDEETAPSAEQRNILTSYICNERGLFWMPIGVPFARRLTPRRRDAYAQGKQTQNHRAPGIAVLTTTTMNKQNHTVEVNYRSGVRLHGAGRLQEAESVYLQVLAVQPEHADSLHMLGVIASQCGQPRAALACIDQAIAIRPATAMFHVNRAAALLALRQLDAALLACQEAVRLKRYCAEAHQVMGHVLSDLGRPEEAIVAYRAALRYKVELPDLYNNLGLALRHAGRLEEAVVALRQAVKRAPRDEQAQSNLAGVLKEMARPAEAEEVYRAALRLGPDDPVPHVNLGIVLLLAGKFEEGWGEYEWRFRAGAAKLPPCSQPYWNGDELAGRTLLIRAEQGMGDTIQFCRYVTMATVRGPIVFEVQPGLRHLMREVAPWVIEVGDALPKFDVWCPLLSLPHLFGMQAPAPPYLTADADRVTTWRDQIGPQGRRIGIAWQGNPLAAAERGRSIPLREFLPLAQLPGVRLISLQKHHGLEQLATTPDGLRIETLGEDFDAGADAFIDTAAVMQCLDLVITSDTSVAHLAGALGRPVWVGLKHVPDWRWLLEGENCLWYPTMRLFRQTRHGDWGSVFAKMAALL
jgi:Flp pilus assembly protein TadD